MCFVSTLPFVVASPKLTTGLSLRTRHYSSRGSPVDASQAIWISAPLDGVLVKVADGKTVQLVAGN